MGFRILMTAGFILVSAGMYFSVKYGLAPKALPLIKATEVASLEEAGVLVYRRMRQEIRAKNLLVAGNSPDFKNNERFWQGFVLGANNDGARFPRVFADSKLKIFPEAKVGELIKVQSGHRETLDQLEADPSTRKLIYANLVDTTHLLEGSLSKKFEDLRRPANLISLTRFLVTKEQVASQNLECSDAGDAVKSQPETLLKDIDCLAKRVSQMHFKKKLDPAKKYVALYRYGRQDYIAYFYSGE